MVESGELPKGTVRYPAEFVKEFAYKVFASVGVPEEDCKLISEVLISADLRGIRSHGAARLTFFMVRLGNGVINNKPKMIFNRGSNTTGTLDADNALGIISSNRAMEEALTMAEEHGSGFVGVRNSNHFGYAGYWAKKAMERGFIGISMSNGGRRATATFGAEAIFGTNPMSIAIPGGADKTDFHLDMATSTVAVGKIETALREGREIPKGWVPEAYGNPSLNEKSILNYDVPLLPLGGEGDATGGHKGYGLSLMVDLLCGVLAGSNMEERMAGAGGDSKAGTGHFMGAIKLGGFRSPSLIHEEMSDMFSTIRNSKKVEGKDKIYIHGEPEKFSEEENLKLGVPITPPIREQMIELNKELSLGYEL